MTDEPRSGEKARNKKRAEGTIARRMPSNIPEEHRETDDTRLEWLWNQRLIVVQNIYSNSSMDGRLEDQAAPRTRAQAMRSLMFAVLL